MTHIRCILNCGAATCNQCWVCGHCPMQPLYRCRACGRGHVQPCICAEPLVGCPGPVVTVLCNPCICAGHVATVGQPGPSYSGYVITYNKNWHFNNTFSVNYNTKLKLLIYRTKHNADISEGVKSSQRRLITGNLGLPLVLHNTCTWCRFNTKSLNFTKTLTLNSFSYKERQNFASHSEAFAPKWAFQVAVPSDSCL